MLGDCSNIPYEINGTNVDISIYDDNVVRITNRIRDSEFKITYSWYVESEDGRDIINWSESPCMEYSFNNEEKEFVIISFVRFVKDNFDERISGRVAKIYSSRKKVVVKKLNYERQSAHNTVCIPFTKIDAYDFCVPGTKYYQICYDGISFDFQINYKNDTKNAVVLGTGAITATRNELPLYSRGTWADDFNCTSIYFFDPSLYLYNDESKSQLDIPLVYGYGTKNRWFLEDIAYILSMILTKMNIEIKNTIFFGSSGGGQWLLCWRPCYMEKHVLLIHN